MRKTIDEVANTGFKVGSLWVSPLRIREQRRLYTELQQLLGEEVVLFLMTPEQLSTGEISKEQIQGRVRLLLLQHYEALVAILSQYGISEEQWGELSVEDCYRVILILMNSYPTEQHATKEV